MSLFTATIGLPVWLTRPVFTTCTPSGTFSSSLQWSRQKRPSRTSCVASLSVVPVLWDFARHLSPSWKYGKVDRPTFCRSQRLRFLALR